MLAATANGSTPSPVLDRINRRWSRLKPHRDQSRYFRCRKRFVVNWAARRSGKSEIAKRVGVLYACTTTRDRARVVFAAPTRAQAKEIYWEDLKRLVPPPMMDGRPRETDLTIRLINGSEIIVVGMDRPERIEGSPIDWIFLDEYGNMHEQAWGAHVRPALDTIGRPGRAWFIGVPEGRNHYWKLSRYALEQWEAEQRGENPGNEWAPFTWTTASVNPEAAAAAQKELDALTFNQEYLGQFVSFESRAYYAFDAAVHAAGRVHHIPGLDVFLCFDFNRQPGVCVIAQEQPAPLWLDESRRRQDGKVVAAIDEVYIERNSNTPRVCARVIEKLQAMDLGRVRVRCYADASGDNKTAAAVDGSDLDLIRAAFRPVFGSAFQMCVPDANPRERARVNVVNSRLESADGKVGTVVDPVRCPALIRDFDGVEVTPEGEIIKEKGGALTHISDGWGYMAYDRYTIDGSGARGRVMRSA